MILVIDIGNTNIVVGCIEGERTYFTERMATDKQRTELEALIGIKSHCWQRTEVVAGLYNLLLLRCLSALVV